MRKKIEMSTERIHAAKLKEEQARKVCPLNWKHSLFPCDICGFNPE